MTNYRKYKHFHYDYLKGATLVGTERYPLLRPTQLIPDPDKLLTFGEQSMSRPVPPGYTLDNFVDDYKNESIYNNCDRYLDYFRLFLCLIGTDYSAYRNSPLWERKYNIGRNRTLSFYLQQNNIPNIPTASWAYLEDFAWCLDGLPENSSIAISTNGCVQNFISHQVFIEGVKLLQKILSPSHLIIYGKHIPELDEQFDNLIYCKTFSQRMHERIKATENNKK